MKSQQSTNAFVKDTFMDLKTQLEIVAKNHQASIQNLKTKFDRLTDKKFGRPSGSLPSNTQPNLRGNNSKAYQPPQSRNEHVNVVFTKSRKSYDPPVNPNDQQNETPFNFDSDDEDEEPTPQPKTQPPKPIKETPIPKPYKPKISYPQRLRKEKMEAQYGKFLDIIRAVRINVPLVNVLAGMPNYGKFLKELISNKHKIEQISAAFLSDESSAMIQNKVPPKLGDPRSFLIPCNFNKTFSCNALADLGASINLMPYSLYAKLSLETLKPAKMSVRLADRSFQYPLGGGGKITQEVLNAAAHGIFLYKMPNQAYQLLEYKVLLKLDWAEKQKTKSSLKKTVVFAAEGSSNFDTDKIMARMDSMTIKMDAQYKELQSHAKQPTPDLDEDDIPMSREEEAKFMQTFYNYRSNADDKSYDLQRQFNDFMKSQQSTNAFVKDTFMDLKTQLETVAKNHQASIQNLETKFDRLADKQSGRPSGSLPSNTQPNPRGNNSKAYQPPQSRNEHVNVVFTRSGKSYDPPVNPNDQQNNSKTPINFDSDDEDEEPTPQPKTQKKLKKHRHQNPVRINVPLVDVLAGMPNYGKFLKELISNKHKIEQISAAFLSDESSAMIQNKVPPKLGDPRSFLIPCNFNKTFSCNALADLGASINLMPYSLYAKLSLETLKPAKMSVRLADRSFQYPVGIAENMLVEVG
ncbi:reverse transcriptase domain-containing protein [Tanacetum coccineum]